MISRTTAERKKKETKRKDEKLCSEQSQSLPDLSGESMFCI